MAVIRLAKGEADARISTSGGSVLGLTVGGLPLLRPAADDAGAIDSACYPLVPFGNRIRSNRFAFEGRVHTLEPNTQWDPHYLHGEGWLADWTVVEQAAGRLVITHRHTGGSIPYAYVARQEFQLLSDGMELSLSVTNEDSHAMPFGIGWHPYFPMTPLTTLQTATGRMWTEEPGWLPGKPVPAPADLDFSQPRRLPVHWVNNAFEDWSGNASICWPEHGRALRLDADPLFTTVFIFVSDTSFDPSYKRDFFALEPMSHLPDGHNLPGLGGLKTLQPGETLVGSMRLVVETL
ncbi:MAG: aldose 1-epimerase [Rhizobiaceae bacterium]